MFSIEKPTPRIRVLYCLFNLTWPSNWACLYIPRIYVYMLHNVYLIWTVSKMTEEPSERKEERWLNVRGLQKVVQVCVFMDLEIDGFYHFFFFSLAFFFFFFFFWKIQALQLKFSSIFLLSSSNYRSFKNIFCYKN